MQDLVKDNGYENPDLRDEPSRTHQSFADECDINTIMRKWHNTGVINHVNTAQGVYGDFSSGGDFHVQLQKLEAAQAAFDQLPAPVRARMENDPAKLIDFVSNDANRAEALELGLLEVPEGVLPSGAHTPPPENEPAAPEPTAPGGEPPPE